MTPPGIKPATFQLVAQCHNKLRLDVQETRHLFFAQMNLVNVANFLKFCNETQTVNP